MKAAVFYDKGVQKRYIPLVQYQLSDLSLGRLNEIFFFYLKHHFLNLFKSSLFSYESLMFSFPISSLSPLITNSIILSLQFLSSIEKDSSMERIIKMFKIVQKKDPVIFNHSQLGTKLRLVSDISSETLQSESIGLTFLEFCRVKIGIPVYYSQVAFHYESCCFL